MESLLRDKILKHLDTQDLLSGNQHGFTRNRSCLTNLLETLEEWTQALDDGCGVDAIFLDYQKAFDTVPHQRLIRKLKGYGIGGMVLEWIQDFLTNRKMRVVLNGHETDWAAVLSGVPQGSVLGPLLFLIYVNEISDIIDSSVKMFADDTKLWRKIQSNDDEQILQQDLNRLEDWSREWLLKFNVSKCKVMQIGPKKTVNYYLQDGTDFVKLQETEMEKDLGVWINNDLKWSQQCRKSASKAMSVLGMIKRSFKQIDIDSFKILYNTYIRPHLEYCVQVWNPYYKKDIECLEKIQKRATKLVRCLARKPYEERLHILGLFSLERRRMRGDFIETYKIMKGIEDVDEKAFFQKSVTGNLRGHNLKLYQKRSRLNIRQFFFSQRIVEHWNRLPQDVVSAPSLNIFKLKLDKWMERYRH